MNKKTHTLLIVDDEENVLKSLERLFEDKGYDILTALNGKKALEKLRDKEISLIICDHRMPEMDGNEFFQNVMQIVPDTIRVMMTGFAEIDVVIDSINNLATCSFVIKGIA